MAYQSAFKEEQTHTEKRRMEFSTEEAVRGPTRAKATPKASEAEHSNKLDEKQTKSLDKCLQFIKTSGEAVQALRTKTDSEHQTIARSSEEKWTMLQLLWASNNAICTTIKDSGECLDFIGFTAAMAQSKKDYNAQKAHLDNLVKLAKQASGEKPAKVQRCKKR